MFRWNSNYRKKSFISEAIIMNRFERCNNCLMDFPDHIAMYCPEVQQFLRCEDTKCWRACRQREDHDPGCSAPGRPLSQLLDIADPNHRICNRFIISSLYGTIRRYKMEQNHFEIGPIGVNHRSPIAQDIHYRWDSASNFAIHGPKTMYFRVLLMIDDEIAARIDVANKKSELTVIRDKSIEQFYETTSLQQTIAILEIYGDHRIQIDTADKYFRFCIHLEEDGFLTWTEFEQGVHPV